ncbi:hypothetical protein MPLA_1440012 [Mesorhizobium sp. ORS 3359]|nr:hypothetical protein MPLA_1440012 [Mesorhizobium sp. ORS 3359]
MSGGLAVGACCREWCLGPAVPLVDLAIDKRKHHHFGAGRPGIFWQTPFKSLQIEHIQGRQVTLDRLDHVAKLRHQFDRHNLHARFPNRPACGCSRGTMVHQPEPALIEINDRPINATDGMLPAVSRGPESC